MENENQPQPYHLDKLKEHFGHSSFRPKQWNIIHSIIENRQDNCVVMASGYGKSLIYQYPSVWLGGLTIVISPLISLMQDQVRSLELRNIPSCFLGSAQPDDLTPAIKGGMYRIVYVTPEYFMSERGQRLLSDVSSQLNLIAIDEAHSVSTWGHKFREDYRRLEGIRNNPICSTVPILAVTSVATSIVRKDIVATLGLRNAQIWCTGFDRPNLQFLVKMKSSDIWTDLKALLNENLNESIIIYCLTRKLTDSMAYLLNSNGIDCVAYHSDIPKADRRTILESFLTNRIKVIVATVAFGMGIDKSDVRLVIHYGVPLEFETYYQGVGQAGRDGLQSKCVLFWQEEDFEMHQFIRSFQGSTTNEQDKTNQNRHSAKLHEYLLTQDCRKMFILQYFEGINPICCDNCESISTQEEETKWKLTGSVDQPMEEDKIRQT